MASTFARKLRATPTDAEIRLWSRLRRKQLDGFRFRRQQPIGRYVVDFFCPEAASASAASNRSAATSSISSVPRPSSSSRSTAASTPTKIRRGRTGLEAAAIG